LVTATQDEVQHLDLAGRHQEKERAPAPAMRALAYRPMSERVLSRIGAASGIVSFVVTFVGFGVHGGLPSATTAAAIKSYVSGVSAGQTALGNYLELLGYLLFLAFATYLYAVARAVGADRFH
jgi:hypothetical protein